MAVDDAGQIVIWFTASLDSRQPIVLSVDGSTWCIALHAEKYLLAVGTNHHDVVLFRLAGDPSTLKQGQSLGSITQSSLTSTTQSSFTSTKQILQGHEHNVPSVDFSLDGSLVMSCSVDGCYRIWRVDDGTCVRTESICARGSDDPSHWYVCIGADVLSNCYYRGWCVRAMDDREIPFSDLSSMETSSSGNQEALSYLTDMFQTHDVVFDDESDLGDMEFSDYDVEHTSIDDSDREVDYDDVDSDDQDDDQDTDNSDREPILIENPYIEDNDRLLEDDDWYNGAYYQERGQSSHDGDLEYEGDPVTMPDMLTMAPLPVGVHVPGAWPDEDVDVDVNTDVDVHEDADAGADFNEDVEDDEAIELGEEANTQKEEEMERIPELTEPETTLGPTTLPPSAQPLKLDHTPIVLCTTRSNAYLFDPFGCTDAVHGPHYTRHGYSRLAAAGQISQNLGYLLETTANASTTSTTSTNTTAMTTATTTMTTATTANSNLDRVQLPDVIPTVRDRRQQLLERVTRGMFSLRQAPIRRLAFAHVLRHHSGKLHQQFPGIVVMADQNGQALLLQISKTLRNDTRQYRMCPIHWMPETPPDDMIFGWFHGFLLIPANSLHVRIMLRARLGAIEGAVPLADISSGRPWDAFMLRALC